MTQNGIIAIDKPEGISSAAVVAKIKKKLGLKKVGHTGTLDPFATGLMLCGINKGTKLSRFFLGSSKNYVAEVALGIGTDTQDYTGHIVKHSSPELIKAITNQTIIESIERFKGVQMQNPPIYSALKHNGKPLYQLAREGHPVQKPPRKIQIHSIEVQNIQKISESEYFKNISLPDRKFLSVDNFLSMAKFLECLSVTISIHCSSGTYIRSLAHDIGEQLGCGGCLTSLRRTRTSGFSIDDAITMSQLEGMSQEGAFTRIIPMAQAVSFLPAIQADDALIDIIRFGRTFRLSDTSISLSLIESAQSEYLPSLSNEYLQLSNSNEALYMRVIGTNRELAAIVEYDRDLDKYDYCCVFMN